MTKKEFQESNEPLVMIVSLNPEDGKVIYDTYDWKDKDFWIEHMQKEFPEFINFYRFNEASNQAIKENLLNLLK